MADDRDDLIRSRAYELWEAEGSPHGRHDDHWTQAAREIGEAQEEAAPNDASASAPAEAQAAGTTTRRARKPSTSSAPAPKGRRKKDG